ncbi:MAG: metallophosphoesterase [Acidimicrobiaceae bacterium]|nr:metallophosphoesterase [Acidimicrobiaceae bacterium]
MSAIRFVVLSDLHFGAENSIMTSVAEHPRGAPSPAASGAAGPEPYEPVPTTPSPVLLAVTDALRSLVDRQDDPPTLILAGDVLDLALSSDAVAAAAFEGFVDAVFGQTPRLFADTVYYLPGNHDHHLWESAREAQYLSYLEELDPAAEIGQPWHVTGLLPSSLRPAHNSLMQALIRRRPGGEGVTVMVAYPNLALLSSDGRRCRMVSHGHFSEPIYTLMSQLRDLLFPEQRDPDGLSIAAMEAENFAWIDFFWSTLGRSGEVGSDVGLVYADLTSAADLDELSANLVHSLVARNHGPLWLRPVESRIITAIAQREVNHLARSERGTPGQTLSARTESGLRVYLEGPVRRQMEQDLGGVVDDFGFIFGHTHKPFVADRRLAGYPSPVRISNTGGWVVDTTSPAPTQGGVAVLLDDELNTASLQFFRQESGGGAEPVRVLAPADPGDNALHDILASEIDPTSGVWRAVSDAAARLIPQRHQLQAELVRQTR